MNFREFFRYKLPGLWFEPGSWLEKMKELLLMPSDIYLQVLDYIPRLRDVKRGDPSSDALVLEAQMRNFDKYGKEPNFNYRIGDSWNIWAEAGSRYGLNRLITMIGYEMDDTVFEYGIQEQFSNFRYAYWGDVDINWGKFQWGWFVNSNFAYVIYITDPNGDIYQGVVTTKVKELVDICYKFAPAHCYLAGIYFTDGAGNILQSYGNIPSPIALKNALQDIYSTDLVGLWVGEDIKIDVDGNVTSWPGQVGPTLAATTNKFTLGVINNTKRAMSTNYSSTSNRYLSASIGTFKTAFSVAVTPTTPFGGYYVSVRTEAGGDEFICCDIGTSNLYPTGFTHYIDGNITHALTSGPHILESDKATSNVGSTLLVGGTNEGSPDRAWAAPIGCIILLNVTPTNDQRTETINLLKAYGYTG